MRFTNKILVSSVLLLLAACQGLDTVNNNNPTQGGVLTTGNDLVAVLRGGYVTWWQSVHSDIPVIGLSVAADAYSLPWDNYGAKRMSDEPRKVYNNRTTEENDYRRIAETPWNGCLSAVSSANDVLSALDDGVSIDNGGSLDESARAAAYFLRGVSWGYLGLIFDKALKVEEDDNLTQALPFSTYQEMVEAAEGELNKAIAIAETQGDNFILTYFNGITFDSGKFVRLCHSYAARFLAQWPRTAAENAEVDWSAVLAHAEKGLNYDFAPLADGKFWFSYQQHVFAETGQGPFWARLDQRLVAAMDPSQPARYPEVIAQGEAPLAHPMATSADARLSSDFVFVAANNFPADRGEWNYSHYKHNRNLTSPSFAGDGFSSGPMPVFLAADNDLLRAEALLRLSHTAEAIAVINAGTRTTRGQLPALSGASTPAQVEQAIMYERAIELLSTGPMNLWFDRRRIGLRLDYLDVDALGGLQTGTPAQMPVPASELKIRNLDPYNFGGPQDPEGIVPIF